MSQILGLITVPHDFDLQWSVKAFLSHFALGYIFSLIFYLAVMRLFVPWSKEIWNVSRCVAFWGAFISVAVDADHIVLLFGREYGRPWHKPLAAFAAVVAVFTFVRLIRRRLDKSFNHVEEIKRVRGNLLLCVLSSCVVLHVAEDYFVKWF